MTDDQRRTHGSADEEITTMRDTLHGDADRNKSENRSDDLLRRIGSHDQRSVAVHAGWPWVMALGVLVLVLGISIPMLDSRWDGNISLARVKTPTPSATATPSGPPSLPTVQRDVVVYEVGRDDGLLYREFRDLATQGDPLRTAVAAVLNVAPLDADYQSRWDGGSVLSATVAQNLITVDLSKSAFSTFTSEQAASQAVRQMVYTATAAVDDDNAQKRVRILMEGSRELPQLGVPATDFERDDVVGLAGLWIRQPDSQQRIDSGEVVITGFILRGEGLPQIRIATADSDTVIDEGDAEQLSVDNTAPGRTGRPRFAWVEWRYAVTIEPGEYSVTASHDGRSDTKTFVVE